MHHRHRVVRNDSESNSEAETNRVQPKIYPTNRCNDISKRRPFVNAHKLSGYSQKPLIKPSKSELTQTDFLKLPYVSKSSEDYCSQRKNAETTIVENKLLETCERKKTAHQGSVKSNNDPGVSFSSSGYSSSSSGNGSFSSSISNASFRVSTSPLATSGEHYRSKNNNADYAEIKLEKNKRIPEKPKASQQETFLEISDSKTSTKVDKRRDQDSNNFQENKKNIYNNGSNRIQSVKDSLHRSQSLKEPTVDISPGRNR